MIQQFSNRFDEKTNIFKRNKWMETEEKPLEFIKKSGKKLHHRAKTHQERRSVVYLGDQSAARVTLGHATEQTPVS